MGDDEGVLFPYKFPGTLLELVSEVVGPGSVEALVSIIGRPIENGEGKAWQAFNVWGRDMLRRKQSWYKRIRHEEGEHPSRFGVHCRLWRAFGPLYC